MRDPAPIAEDAMAPVALFLSLGEAMVAEAAVRAEGIICHLGGALSAQLMGNSVALHGIRLWVPVAAYAEASAALASLAAEETPVAVLHAYRRRVLHLCAAHVGAMAGMSLWTCALLGSFTPLPMALLISLLSPIGSAVPPPPWRGDYYLLPAAMQ
jgi:hypothetical protein